MTALWVWAAIGAAWTTVALLIGLAVGRTARLREDRDDHDDLHDAEALAVARDAELVDTANRSPDPVHHVLFELAWPTPGGHGDVDLLMQMLGDADTEGAEQ